MLKNAVKRTVTNSTLKAKSFIREMTGIDGTD